MGDQRLAIAERSLSVEYCVLSVEEAARLENWGVWPCCRKTHLHINKTKALEMVRAETHRLVGGVDTRVRDAVTMIVPVAVGRMWRPVQAHNVDGSMIMGFRTWGLERTR